MRQNPTDEELAKGYFANHRVCQSPLVPALRWKRPGTGNCWVDYFVFGSTLFVRGDLGDAVYQWSEPVTFEWLSGIDLSYFVSKCQASELGSLPREWSDNDAFEGALCHFSECLSDDIPRRLVSDDWRYTKFQQKFRAIRFLRKHVDSFENQSAADILSSLKEACWCRESFSQFLYHEVDSQHDHIEIISLGDVLPLRQRLHHIGLRLAVAQLPEDYRMPTAEWFPSEPAAARACAVSKP